MFSDVLVVFSVRCDSIYSDIYTQVSYSSFAALHFISSRPLSVTLGCFTYSPPAYPGEARVAGGSLAQGAGRTEDEDMAELSQEDQQEVRIGEA